MLPRTPGNGTHLLAGVVGAARGALAEEKREGPPGGGPPAYLLCPIQSQRTPRSGSRSPRSAGTGTRTSARSGWRGSRRTWCCCCSRTWCQGETAGLTRPRRPAPGSLRLRDRRAAPRGTRPVASQRGQARAGQAVSAFGNRTTGRHPKLRLVQCACPVRCPRCRAARTRSSAAFSRSVSGDFELYSTFLTDRHPLPPHLSIPLRMSVRRQGVAHTHCPVWPCHSHLGAPPNYSGHSSGVCGVRGQGPEQGDAGLCGDVTLEWSPGPH